MKESKKIILKAHINKSNQQINFSLRKKELPKSLVPKLKNLKGLEFKMGDLVF